MTIKKPLCAFATVTPCCCTSVGKRAVDCWILFCTCTCAVSGLVPCWKVIVMAALPDESLLEEK